VLEHLDAREAVLVGHSMGGMAAQAFAVRHKEILADRVGALVLVGTTATGVAAPGLESLGPALLRSRGCTRVMRSSAVGPFLVRHTVGQHAVWDHLAVTAELVAATPPDVRADFFTAMAALDLTADLPGVTVPTFVVSGTKDRLLPHPLSNRIANLIPGARLVALDGAGHQLMFEQPDRVAEVIVEAAERRSQLA
ncbi:MAG: alpha/beta fold hydrolase, partial [Acidimicrobiales bacterium]